MKHGRDELDLLLQRRSVDLDLYLPFSNKGYLLSTTRARYSSIGFGLGLSGRVKTWSTFSLQWLVGGVLSGPYAANFDVISPFGFGTRFQTDGDGQKGLSLRVGCRGSKELGTDISAFVEIVPYLVVMDEYRWSVQRGLPLQPTTPARTGGCNLNLGVSLRL